MNISNVKCINGYKAYNNELPSDFLPPDFLSCHAICNPSSKVDFIQTYVYGCAVGCETTGKPPLANLVTKSALQACQAKCPLCDPQDILCLVLQSQFNQCRMNQKQCLEATKLYNAAKDTDQVPFAYYACFQSCPPSTTSSF